MLARSIFILSFFLLSATPAFAKEAEVLGFVQNCSELIPFVPVTATCGTQSLTTLTGSTGGDLGKYSITFNNTSCIPGSTVSVNTAGLTNTGVIGTYFFFIDKAHVSIQTGTNCVENPAVPEFGLLSGGLALAASYGSYALLRRRAARN